jgi:hypothetical protein
MSLIIANTAKKKTQRTRVLSTKVSTEDVKHRFSEITFGALVVDTD